MEYLLGVNAGHQPCFPSGRWISTGDSGLGAMPSTVESWRVFFLFPEFGRATLLFIKEKVGYWERKPPGHSQRTARVHSGLGSHLAAALGWKA